MTVLTSDPVRSRTAHRKSLEPSVFWRIAEDIPPRWRWSLMALSVVVPVLVWTAISITGWVDSRFLPTPMMVWQALIKLWQDDYLISDALSSFLRVSGGFALAAIASVPLGIGMGAFRSIRALLEPIVGIVRYMPAPAFIPLLIIYLGLGEEPKVTLIFIGTVFFNTLMIMDAVKFVPKELIETTYTLGGNRLQVLLRVITPYVFPSIIDTFRVNMAAAWNLVIVAELVAADGGLGKRIAIAQKFFQTDTIFACLIVLGLIGFVLDLSLQALMRVTCKWAVK